MTADTELRQRVKDLENWRQVTETRVAVEAERMIHLDARFDKIEKDVSTGFGEIKGAFWRVFWAVMMVFILGFANWVMNGGLGG